MSIQGKGQMPATSTMAELMAKIRTHIRDDYTKMHFDQFEEAMLLMPMKNVLAKVGKKDQSITGKADRVGVSRNTWYRWERGEVRPNKTQAKRLEQLTKIPAEKFQGRR